MAIIFFNGSGEDEQAKGGVLDAGVMEAYVVNTNSPTQLIYLGGHFMDDAPTYNNTEARVLNTYKHVNGRNIIEETQTAQEVVKSVTFNLMLPKRALSVTDRLYQQQKSQNYNIVFAPDTCADPCDNYFWVAKDIKFGIKQITSTILGFDENGNPIDTMRTLRGTGNMVTYLGLETKLLATMPGSAEIHGIAIVDERCEGDACPYQKFIVVGDGIARLTEDGGASFTALTITAITTDLVGAILTDVKYAGGNYVVSYADVVAAPTDGGVAYSVDGAAFVLATGITAGIGIVGLLEAFGKLYAYGESGSLFVSCDNGVSWAAVTTGIATDLLAAAYDKYNNLVLLGGEDNTLYTWDGTTFTDISTAVTWVAGTSDVLDIANFGKGRFAVGTYDGKLYEHYDITNASAANPFVATRTLATTVLVGGIAGDDLGARLLWGEAGAAAGNLQLRDVTTKMSVESQYTLGAADTVYAAAVGKPLEDEGHNYFLFGTALGKLIQVAACNLCVNTDC